MRVVAEASGAESLELELDVVLASEETADRLAGFWEAQTRRGFRRSLPAVLLLTAPAHEARFGRPAPPPVLWRFSELPVRAWGLLAREAAPQALEAAVRALQEGLIVGGPGLLSPPPDSSVRPPSARSAPHTEGQAPALSSRETEVLCLLAQGLGNKQIARALNISENTVKFHTSAIYEKLGAANRTEALRKGLEFGLLSM